MTERGREKDLLLLQELLLLEMYRNTERQVVVNTHSLVCFQHDIFGNFQGRLFFIHLCQFLLVNAFHRSVSLEIIQWYIHNIIILLSIIILSIQQAHLFHHYKITVLLATRKSIITRRRICNMHNGRHWWGICWKFLPFIWDIYLQSFHRINNNIVDTILCAAEQNWSPKSHNIIFAQARFQIEIFWVQNRTNQTQTYSVYFLET